MSVPLRTLLAMAEDGQTTVLAGEAGLDGLVQWVHMVEGIEISTFLQGGELVFVTGIALGGQVTLLDLVKEIYKNHAVGVVVNVGPYIPAIPQEVIRYCQDKGFPLISAPWSVHMAILMKRFSEAILVSDQIWQELGLAIRAAIFTPEREERYLSLFENKGLTPGGQFCVALVEQADGSQPGERLLLEMEDQLGKSDTENAFCLLNHQILILCAGMSEADTTCLVDQILARCRKLFPGLSLYAGVGRAAKNARCICKSYRLADKVLLFQKKRKITGVAGSYSQQGVYRLLMGVEDSELLREYTSAVLAPLLDCDRATCSDHIAFLKAWFACGCSSQRTAEALFLHRNTVDYRLRRMEELLGCDLSDFDTRVELDLALKLL